ncbi:serine hydrolase domain-containing protein [Caulobacter sp. NIBR2454]|uniref:serine hydrolase domain-containing protein n=1 Tax=Caulobacter sp. NIBR2454 TaxID=3015996 RepID=UPI0022B6A990|nr:serine hydrolase domain-containing protein [Caulobacter sp. NIBR2454]
MRVFRNAFVSAVLAFASPAVAEIPKAQIDAIINEVLAESGSPSASVAVVQDGRIAHLAAFGQARLDPPVVATTETRYGIASVSKQFTAASILLLADDGKLTLDDPVGRYVPNLTDGDRITLRDVLNNVSGYTDYWPQDFVFARMKLPASRDDILNGWARTPLEFPTRTEYRYSNTGFVVAGMVVEKVSGQSLMDFQRRRIFDPLRMTGVTENDSAPLKSPDAANYTRYGAGALRPADKEGPGWLFAAAHLAMRPADLALWNISLMDASLLKPASVAALTQPGVLKSGQPTSYALGLRVSVQDGRRVWSHGGALSGVHTDNRIWPDEKLALSVMVNTEDNQAQSVIADRLAFLLLPSTEDAAIMRGLLADAAAGRIDRSRLTPNADAFFTPQVLADYQTSLSALGPLRLLRRTGGSKRGGMTYASFDAVYAGKVLWVSLRMTPDGKIEQFMAGPKV